MYFNIKVSKTRRFYTVIRFVWVTAKFCTVVSVNMEHLWKIKSVDSRMNVHILASTSNASAKFSNNSNETDDSVLVPTLYFLFIFLYLPGSQPYKRKRRTWLCEYICDSWWTEGWGGLLGWVCIVTLYVWEWRYIVSPAYSYTTILTVSPHKTVAEFIDPWMGYKVNSGIGLSYCPASTCSLAGRYNPMPELTLSPQSGSMKSL